VDSPDSASSQTPGAELRGDQCTRHPSKSISVAKPNTWASVAVHPSFTQRTADFASGYMLESATPADEQNHTIDSPNPTA